LQGKFENIPPLLAGEVMRAVLTGARYPQSLLAAVITRLRAGEAANIGWHAAVLRAVLVRARRTPHPHHAISAKEKCLWRSIESIATSAICWAGCLPSMNWRKWPRWGAG
jgi:hypothetical protein